ncbi:bis(5'-adenosyl)-triphosphatase, putative [Babesia bigemina]|uniref:Bis(5'-adenosyl)-triphosphatase n=1 Tax=Babesia bigemina TaxID=5866 RepID=A0A061DEY6_BABBI|nr:bis(5'-adenosyl)-triphosphatase, putative [Babesia bigemina]CDR98095.1 bis(5'-adenosyl)-triphosphatase, putative [Babesia bigemina]|eukprot:XP_012770281.1 bis(5'-adenosyl)-triphosphatase, putative [Babesia bigemina]
MTTHHSRILSTITSVIPEEASFLFGSLTLPYTQVLAKSELSYAFVNIRPFMPGHTLVSPLRVVKRYRDMTAEELSDFSALVQITAEALELKYGATASTIVIQDGKAAGQTIPHVHAHVIPRHEKDLENPDSIYDELEKPTNRLWTDEEMAVCARETRPFVDKVIEEGALGCLKPT